MIRYSILYFLFLIQKIKNLGHVQYNGFTIVFAFKNCIIDIGKKTVINSSSTSNLLGLYQRTIIIARYKGKIHIGNNVGISGSTIYSMSEVEIGDNTIIGANCKIIDNDFHPLDQIKRIQNNIEDVRKNPISIGDNCFIGMNSIILKGTVIGNNCIIGAGSVVSGIFPQNAIIAGNPAKIIKFLHI